jgi:hypothetical protein
MNEDSKAEDIIIDEEIIAEENNPKITSSPERSFFDILKTKTGEGSIESYMENPLNLNHSQGLAQILRGLTGFVGALDLAILDLIIGGFKIYTDYKKPQIKVVSEDV